jgi:protein AroM
VTLGIVTVGQAPRTDLTGDLQDLLAEVEVIEHGALDGHDPSQLDALSNAARASLKANEGIHVLHTRLADGGSIVYLESDALPRTQAAVQRAANDGATAVLLACTGTFPKLDAPVPVLYPERLLQQVALAVHDGGPVAVLTPDAAQHGDQERRWRRILPPGIEVSVYAVSPYRPAGAGELDEVVEAFASSNPHLVVMDCIGYTRAMRARLAEALPAGRPVLTAREVAVRIALAVAG